MWKIAFLSYNDISSVTTGAVTESCKVYKLVKLEAEI